MGEHKIAGLGKFMSCDGSRKVCYGAYRAIAVDRTPFFLPVLQFKGSGGSFVGCGCSLTPSFRSTRISSDSSI